MDKVKRKIDLEKAIIALKSLLDNRENLEEKYQDFFEKNAVVFDILGYSKWWPFTKKSGNKLPKDIQGKRPEPDFIVQRKDGLYEIFELKTPFVKEVLTKHSYRKRFTSSMFKNITQTTEYGDYFDQDDNRRNIKSIYRIDLQKDLNVKIAIGVKKNLDKKEIDRYLKRQKKEISLILYDEILDDLIGSYKKEFGDYENWRGISFHCLVRFHGQGNGEMRYFFVFGKGGANTVSMYLSEDDDICVKFVDEKFRPHSINIENRKNLILSRWIYLSFELGSKDGQYFFSINLQGREKDRREKTFYGKIIIDFINAFLGCDANKQNFGHFDITKIASYNRILTLEEKYKLFDYFSKKKNSIKNYLSFNGNKFMCRELTTGDFVQNDPMNRPVVRKMRYS